MRLNWFSPLPPEKSDIAAFSMRVLKALSPAHEPFAWTATEAERQHAAAAGIRAAVVDDGSWAALNEARASIYNIGNNGQFHSALCDRLFEHPGLCIVHDPVLTGLHWHWAQGAEDWKRRFADYPLWVEALFRRALAVVVHSRHVLSHDLIPAGVPVFQLDLPYCGELDERPAPLPNDNKCRLIMFGYFGKNRCIDEVVSAVAAVRDRVPIELQVFGLDDNNLFAEAVARHECADLVQFSGFVEESKLNAAIRRADLAISLRSPSMGEASSSVLRAWANRTAPLVSMTGWYATLPPGAAIPIGNANLREQLIHHFCRIPANRAWYAEVGERGYRHLIRNHRPETYAKSLAACCEQTPALRAQWVARQWAALASPTIRRYRRAFLAGETLDELSRQWTERAGIPPTP